MRRKPPSELFSWSSTFSAITLLVGFSLLIGCNADETKTGETKADSIAPVAASPSPTEHNTIDSLANAALEYCNCFKQSMGRFDPYTEALILKSVEQPEPMRFLETEIQKMTDLASREQALKDLQTFSNFDAASPCILSVSQHYGIDETDPTTLQRIVSALEKYPDCKLVTALFKVAYNEEKESR